MAPRRRRLDGGDQRQTLEDLAHFGDARGDRRLVGRAERPHQPHDVAGIDVGRGTDAPGAAGRDVLRNQRFGGRVDLELGERLDRCLGVVPVARGILEPDEDARVLAQQRLDQRQGDRHARHLRDVIKIDPEAAVGDRVDHGAETVDQPGFGHALVVEGRQHQRAEAAMAHRMPGERDGVGQRRAPGPRDKPLRADAGVDQHVEHRHALGHAHRVGLAGRAERRKAIGAVGEQGLAVDDEAGRVGREVRRERRDRGNEELWRARHAATFPSIRSTGSIAVNTSSSAAPRHISTANAPSRSSTRAPACQTPGA